MEFINESLIFSLIEDETLNQSQLQREIIKKAKDAKGLTLLECAALLNITNNGILDELFHTAQEVK